MLDPRSEKSALLCESQQLGCWQGGPRGFQCIETLDAHPRKKTQQHDLIVIETKKPRIQRKTSALFSPLVTETKPELKLARARVVVTPCPADVKKASEGSLLKS